jgi:hypothetical protein
MSAPLLTSPEPGLRRSLEMSVHAWLLRLPAVLSESNGDLDAGATVTAAGPLPETLTVHWTPAMTTSHAGRCWPTAPWSASGGRSSAPCLGPTQYGKLR